MADRTSAGRFLTEQPRDTRFLLTIVRDVALAAVATDPKRDPRSVTHDEFKVAAFLPGLVAEYGRIPSPNAICASFPDGDGRPIRWRALLKLALDEERSELAYRREHEARLKVDADLGLTDAHIFFALNYVHRTERARSAKTPPFLRAAVYDAVRGRLVEADKRRQIPHDLEAMLPTRYQIERVAGGWWRACEIAQIPLADSNMLDGRLGVPLVDAVLRYYVASGGFLPSRGQMYDFAIAFDFALQRSIGGRWQRGAIIPARAEIERRHLPEPEPYDPGKNPIVEPPQGYERNPDDPAYQPKHYWSDKPHVLQLVTEYLDWLGARASSKPRWNQFRAEKAIWGVAVPMAQTLTERYGGLDALIREASRAGALERAIAEYERKPPPEEIAEQELRQIERNAATPQAQELLAFIRSEGEIGPQKIQDALGWSRTKVAIWCSALRDAELVAATHETLSKPVRYFAIAEGQTKEELRAIRERRQIELRADRQATPVLLDLLRERGPLRPQTISDALGWGRDKLQDVLDDVLPARLVAVAGQSRSTHYFVIDPSMTDDEIATVREQIEERIAVQTPQAQELLALLREHQALAPKKIRKLIDWDTSKIETWLKPLLEHRLVAYSAKSRKSRYGRYFAIDPQITDEQLAALQRYWDSQPSWEGDEDQLLHTLLLARGESMSPMEIRETLGWTASKTIEQLKVLQRAGLAQHNGASTHQSRWEGRVAAPPPGGWVSPQALQEDHHR